MKSAKVIANMDNLSFDAIKRAKNFINLRLSFLPPEHKSPIMFFIPSNVDGYKNFSKSNPLTHLINLSFTQKPPDDLIEILGNIIKEKEDYEKRHDVRINLEGKIIKDFGLNTNRSTIIIENIKRPCIIKNLSVSGAFIILSCNPKFIMNKKAILNLSIIKHKVSIQIEGVILRNESAENRKDIFGIGIEYNKEKIPLEYKELFNEYIEKLEEMAKLNK